MKTFSVPPTEATQRPDIIDLLNILPDNTTKLISPKDFRDSVYTLWENIMFKPTTITGSTTEYIGFDQYELFNNSDISWYPKVYFGKKQVGGQFVMSDALLGQTNADFFFYNTKNSSVLNDYSTGVAFLSGTGSFIKNSALSAPYIESVPLYNEYGFHMDMNIRNTSYYTVGLTSYGGNINILSEKGNVSLNGLILPSAKIMNDKKDAYDGFVLTFLKGADNKIYGEWRSPFSQSVASIVSTTNYSISAPRIFLNGYNFYDTTIVATGIGGIKAGESFTGVNNSGIDVLDMIRRIIYTYVPPKVTSLLTRTFDPNTEVKLIETGDLNTWQDLRLRASVSRNATQSIISVDYLQLPELSAISINGFPDPVPDGLSNALYRTDPNTNFSVVPPNNYRIHTFTLSVSDQYPTTRSVSSVVRVVLPYFFGTATYSATQSTAATVQNKDDINLLLGINISPPVGKLKSYLTDPIVGNPTFSNNQYLKFTTRGLPGTIGEGKGFIYFGYPAGYPLLKHIYDSNSLDVTNRFITYSISGVNHAGSQYGSPTLWSNRQYIFYITSTETTVELSAGTYSFVFV
jgi:hypothetical protein